MKKAISLLNEYKIALVMIYTAIVFFVNEYFQLNINTKIISILKYLPLFAIVFIFLLDLLRGKLKSDPDKRRSTLDKIAFFTLVLFTAYYVVLTIYRFINKMDFSELMESAHYAVIFIGSMIIYFYASQMKFERANILKNMLVFIFFINVILFLDFLRRGSVRDTIVLANIIIVCCLFLVFYAISYLYLIQKETSPFFSFISYLHIATTNIVIWLSGSRLMLFLGLFADVLFIILYFRHKRVFMKMLLSMLSSFAILALLFVLNVGTTRFSIRKQYYSIIPVSEKSEQKMSAETYKSFQEVKMASTASDQMRDILWEKGKTEVKKNFWFGTGNAVYEYQLGDKIIMQSSHNGILEAMTSFGFIGSIMIAIIIGSIFIQILFFTRLKLNYKAVVVYIGIVVFGFSMLQPILFNLIILPCSMLSLAIIKKGSEEKEPQLSTE